MTLKKVWIIHKLDSVNLNNAIKKDCNFIICNEIYSNLTIPKSIEIISADKYRIEGTWETYLYNNNIVKNLLNKFPSQFKVDNFNLSSSLSKTLYWTNNKIGSLKIAYFNLSQPKVLIHDVNYLTGNIFKEFSKYLMLFFKNNFSTILNVNKNFKITKKANIGILINNEFELKLYEYIIELLNEKENVLLFHYGNIPKSILNDLPENVFEFDLSKIISFKFQKLFNPFRLSFEELKALNIVLAEWQSFSSELARYNTIKNSGIKKLLVNVAENMALRNLMKEVFAEDILVYNTMNGLKGGEAQDADIFFDKWFVWDEEMKKMMIEKCHLPDSKLIVSGHLAKDQIYEWKYKGSFKFDLQVFKTKKVISFFSNRGFRKEKVDALNLLYKFLFENLDYYLIIRPHPLEKKEDYILPDYQADNIYFIPEKLVNSKETLYDQLFLSDLSIVLGSTVAFESLWMEVPCISYEYREAPLIYLTGEDKFKHIQNSSQLLLAIASMQKKSSIKHLSNNRKVSKTIASELLS